ncbi:MAG TPA: choice-of-anchor Q domain-containing protein, partial [Anaerolineales bacterium]|nr:choice-of-anchor Q domain-containing protein [Anaerolineales bacterium]
MHLKNFLYRSISHLHWVLAAALLLGIVSSAWGVGIGRAAATITVNSFEDKVNTDGLCTLREAVIAANKDAASSGNPGECPAGSGADTIVLPALIDNVAGSYILTRTDNGKEDSSSTGDLDITSDITIQGDGGQVVIKTIPGYKDRVFHILSGTTSIKNVTIQGGIPVGDGGGIYNKASLTIEQSTLAGNIATGNGGALYNSGTLTLTNVTLSGNNASLSGGGLYSTTGTTTLNNVTVSANTADKDGNGTGDGGGITRNSGTVSLANSLIGGNSDGSAPNKQQPDCSGSLASLGYNLIQSVTGCTLTGIPTGNRTGVNPNLGPLADNGGPTPTHKLLNGSPAIEAGNPAAPGSSSSACALTDQRGVTRPQGAACDIGAFEAEDPLQTGPVFSVIAVVGANDDRDDGACTFSHCSLREAIQAANARPNDATPDAVHFNLSGGSPVIMVTSPLPEIASPVIIDGATQPGGTLVLNGSGTGADVSGLTVSGGGSTLKGLTIREFRCNGVLLTGSGGNTLQGNTITLNGCNGIHVASGGDNKLTQNLISANGLLAIDLGGDGPTANDTGDADAGANDLQNYPVLFGADPFAEDGVTVVEGRLNGIANTAYALEFFSNQACDVSGFGEAETFLDSVTATTDSRGDAYFQTRFTGLPADRFVSVTATSPTGDTSELSACKRVDARNDSWPAALPLTLSQNGSPVSANQYLDQQGQSRWYFFKIQPNTRLVVTLTGLTANYDLTLYKDIKQAYTELNGDQDLVRLGAEFAADAFNADSFSSDAFNSDAFSPQAFSPQAFSPQAFSPQAFSPQAFSPQAFSPQAFSPEAFLADAYAPQAFSPQAFSPQAFSPQAFSPQAFSPQAFSSAQTRSLIGVSAFDGTASEGLSLNTWENTGDFYVRVRGRNGAFDPSIKYHLEVTQIAGDCANVNTNLPPTSLTGESGSYRTIILTDFARLAGSADDEIALRDRLATFAARSEVRGVVVDVGSDARVAAANAEAERGDNFQCPFAKNQVAYAIKNIVDNYRAKNPLEYVVIIGSDEVVPFFRHADQAMLANEKNYAPPVLDDTASQASLKLGYVLSQDRYGTDLEISHKDESFPIPDLAVGRVVETASDATRMLDAYLNPNRGGILSPTSALVTGYDFLVDNAQAVREDLAIGLGSSSAVDTLITPPHLSPADPSAEVWTADDLRQELFDTRHDLIYLAGHFSAGSALAADFTTRVDSTELLTSLADLENVLIYSAGCHSGYNTVDPHGVPFVTAQPDWAQAANGEGITLIAGTGYQYGDTDFIEYSERLYLEFTRQLRAGSGPVPIGKALMEAKRTYLAETPQLRGIHEKALLEATLFGFPMFAVDMPGQRYTPGGGNTIVTDVSGYASDPGDSLGLEYSDVTINPSLTRFDVPLKNVENNATVMATYLKGKNGVLTNPVEPVLPAEVYNVSVANTVLRGVGFRGGDYTDLDNILPLIGAATTEVRGVHSPFVTEFFFPVRLWSVNYIDALANGPTRLVVTPAHFKLNEASADRGTLRRFDSLKFRLFYSDYVESNPDGTNPALSAAPSIVRVSGTPAGDAVDFQMRVVGNPAAGIQEVWVTYTAIQGSFYNQWQSLDLAQNPLDSTLWEG